MGSCIDGHDATMPIVKFLEGTGQGPGSCDSLRFANPIDRGSKAVPHADGCRVLEVARKRL
jgi:hypothetical protein